MCGRGLRGAAEPVREFSERDRKVVLASAVVVVRVEPRVANGVAERTVPRPARGTVPANAPAQCCGFPTYEPAGLHLVSAV